MDTRARNRVIQAAVQEMIHIWPLVRKWRDVHYNYNPSVNPSRNMDVAIVMQAIVCTPDNCPLGYDNCYPIPSDEEIRTRGYGKLLQLIGLGQKNARWNGHRDWQYCLYKDVLVMVQEVRHKKGRLAA